MHDKRSDEPQDAKAGIPPVNPLKTLSAAEFAALGANHVVFVRPITGRDLAAMMPSAAMVADEAEFAMIMSADGSPLLVTDSDEGVDQWLDEHGVEVATVH